METKTNDGLTINPNIIDWTSIIDSHSWSDPIRVDVIEGRDCIEMIYKQASIITHRNTTPSQPPNERVFKIVYSCIDGKWHKSERIYGKIIPAQSEQYEFEE